jgi:hypothetical protein
MIIKDVFNPNYHLCTEAETHTRRFSGVYTSDLLSRVIKNAQPDALLITTINHITTIATASMVDLSGIILCENQQPTQDMIKRSEAAGIALIRTSLKSHEVIIDLYQRGLI